jgi:glycosyltransferase involved in cell wall biosynthesis
VNNNRIEKVKNRKTACMLTSVHDAFDVRIFYKEAETLSRFGYKVIIIAPGIKKKKERVKDIDIIFLNKPKNRFIRIVLFPWRLLITAKRVNADVYHFHDSELMLIGLFLCITGRCVIYDVHEDLPKQIISKEWIQRRYRKLLFLLIKYFEAFSVNHFSAVITTSEKINDRLSKFNPNTIMVRNFPKLGEISSRPLFHLGHENKKKIKIHSKTIVSLGGISTARCIREFVEAVDMLPYDLEAEIVIAGACNSKILFEELISLPGWARIEYCGLLTRSEALAILEKSCIALILYSPIPNHFEVRSNRLFESMAAGIPVITPNFPHWKNIVLGNECGLVVNPLCPEEIANAIKTILSNVKKAKKMGENGRRAIIEKYNWEKERIRLTELYEKLLDNKK